MKTGKSRKIAEKTMLLNYLKENVATLRMAAKALGLDRANLTWKKRELEDVGRLWEVAWKRCEDSGYHAWYLTANPDLNPNKNQLGLFD